MQIQVLTMGVQDIGGLSCHPVNVLNGARDYAKCDDLFGPVMKLSTVSIHNLCQVKGSVRSCILGKHLPFA